MVPIELSPSKKTKDDFRTDTNSIQEEIDDIKKVLSDEIDQNLLENLFNQDEIPLELDLEEGSLKKILKIQKIQKR